MSVNFYNEAIHPSPKGKGFLVGQVKFPGEVFSGDPTKLKSEYDVLLHKYHPDKNHSPNANEEFIHLKGLYELAQKQIDAGFWEHHNKVLAIKTYRLHFRRKVDLGIGQMYVGDTYVAFLIERVHERLWRNGVEHIKDLKYRSDRMQEEMSRYLPSIKLLIDLPEHFVVILHKTPDLLLLRDVPIRTLPEFDRHVAWIMSTLHNLLCYFYVSKLTHNDISLDTYFVSFKYHSGALLGGWWYSRKNGDKLLSVPKSSYELFPPKMKNNLLADPSLDKELIRAVGRELLGDRIGTKLNTLAPAPRPFVDWLRGITSKTAIEEYSLWDKQILKEAYGAKRFMKADITAESIYVKGES